MITCELVLYDLSVTKVVKHEGRFPVFTTSPFHIAEVPRLSEDLKKIQMFISGCVEKAAHHRVYVGFVENDRLDHSFHWEEVASDPAAIKMKQFMNNLNLSWFNPDWLVTFKENLKPYTKSGTPIQVRAWDRCLLVKTEDYFIKAVPDIFRHEPGVTEWLAEHFSGYVPDSAVRSGNRDQLVMKNMSGTLLGYSDQLSHWTTAAVQLAEIQKEAVHHAADLKVLGCPERRVTDTLAQYGAPVFKQLSEEGFNLPSGLLQYLSDLLKLAETLNVPLSLDHGDFFGGNCMNDDGQIRIFDWSDSSLTHPFLSLSVFLEEVGEVFGQAGASDVETAYLSKWLTHGTIGELKKELKLIQTIEPFFYLIVYEAHIFPDCCFNWDRIEIIQSYLDKIRIRMPGGG